MLIRAATIEDAEAACAVLRRSIAELCRRDHGGDEETLKQWLGNKTPENLRAWIAVPGRRLVVAEENGSLLGVGAATDNGNGEITLNYVAPEARFRGVSKAILAALEAYLHDRGLARSTLTSTKTAHAFYLARGYEDAGEAEPWGKLRCRLMTKAL